MTSVERREGRYRRRIEKRRKKKAAFSAAYDDFDSVFTYEHLYRAYRMCRRNVAWKCSTQKYIAQAPLNVRTTLEKLRAGKFRSAGFVEFDIMERGKKRHIRSVNMTERVVQRCLCDDALVPMLTRTFIHDNGASVKDKGYHFTIRRLCRHLREHYRKHGNEGYILLFDFSKFFDRVSHALIRKIVCKEFSDERLIRILQYFVDAFGSEGLGLGSQVSQILALASANRLDHYVKEICRIRGYGRYMDDGYLIHRSKRYLQSCLDGLRKICVELGITLNERKTQIVKLSHGFSWLKVRFYLTQTGKIVRKIQRRSVTRMRRKIRTFRELVSDGVMTMEDVRASWESWESYAMYFNAWRTIQHIAQLLPIFEKGEPIWTT